MDLLSCDALAEAVPSVIFIHLATLARSENEDIRTPVLNYLSEKISNSKMPHYYSSILSLSTCDPDRSMQKLMIKRLAKVVQLQREKLQTFRKFGVHVSGKNQPEFGLSHLIFLLSQEDQLDENPTLKDHERILGSFCDALLAKPSE